MEGLTPFGLSFAPEENSFSAAESPGVSRAGASADLIDHFVNISKENYKQKMFKVILDPLASR